MPCVGLIPFLQKGGKEWRIIHFPCVNALCRAYSISTNIEYILAEDILVCQCPVSGLFHFYGKKNEKNNKKEVVSMPCVGLIPFLLPSARKTGWKEIVCQCPVSGLFHFYKLRTN